MGIVSALVFGNMGAAYGTAKSGVGICSVAVLKPELIIKSIIPVVMAGILGIYGLIISVIISGSRKSHLPFRSMPALTTALLLFQIQSRQSPTMTIFRSHPNGPTTTLSATSSLPLVSAADFHPSPPALLLVLLVMLVSVPMVRRISSLLLFS